MTWKRDELFIFTAPVQTLKIKRRASMVASPVVSPVFFIHLFDVS
jgi:hypothetical protein